MRTFSRSRLVVALVTLAVVSASDLALAQGGFNFGGGKNHSNDDNQGNRRRQNRDNDENQSELQQFQQFFQGGQGGQGNQNNSGQQFRRNQQQGNQGNQPFKKSQSLQQFIQGGQGGQFHQGQNWQTQKFGRRNELQDWVIGFNGGPRPFSNDWYKNHPQAWHHHHDDDTWAIVTAAGVLGWLGWQNRPYHNTVYVYDPVPVPTVVLEGQPEVGLEPGAAGEWMTLGTYSLLTAAGDPGTRVLQLSVDRGGNVRGSYYDMITNATQNVYGLIDKNTQQVRWTIDTNRQLTFVTTLDQLTQSQGVVNVKLPGGQIQQWQLVRMENGPVGN